MRGSEKINSYFNAEQPSETEVSGALRRIVDSSGAEVFLDKESLAFKLEKDGVSEDNILRILLMVSVPGFKELIDGNENAVENNLNRFVGNAQELTGLSREWVLRLSGDIAAALGYPVVTGHDQYHAALKHNKAFVIPFPVYEKEMKSIRSKLAENKQLEEKELNTLSKLSEEGIAEAQLYMSQYLEQNNPKAAEELLLQAAQQGNGNAQAQLGDLYFGDPRTDHWEKAYECYTGYGTIALNQKRRKSLKDILNHKQYNLKMLQMSLLIIAAMLLTTLFFPTGVLYGTGAFLKVLFILLEAAVWTVAALRYRSHPFAFLNWLIPVMSGIWAVYLIMWIL